MKKYVLILVFIISVTFYWFIISNLIENVIVVRNGLSEFLHYFNIFFVFPAFCTLVTMYFYKKKKKSDYWDYILLMIVFSFGSSAFNGLIEFLNFDMCKTSEVKTLYVNITNSNKIVYRETRCGIIGNDDNLIELKSSYLMFFSKYQEIDTNSLDLSNWKKL